MKRATALMFHHTFFSAPRVIVNGALSPGGDLPGSLHQDGPMTLGAGGRLLFDMQNPLGQPGFDWDFLGISDSLDFQSTTANPFVLQLRTLSDLGFGPMLNFDHTISYNWIIASANAGISNFSGAKFSIDHSAFLNDLAGGYFLLTT